MSENINANLALVEDDDSIRELLEYNLHDSGFAVDSFFSIEQFEKVFQPRKYDLLLLDIMLPGESGLQFAEKIKKSHNPVPILFISALGAQTKIAEAYKLGAIDYIVKPFEMDLLLSKIQNLLYHFVPRGHSPLPGKIGIGEINWNLMQVKSGDNIYSLSPKEAQALLYFVQNPDRIISRNELIEHIWGSDVFVSGRNIDNFLVKFRKIFEEDQTTPELFLTFPKKGYAYKKNPGF